MLFLFIPRISFSWLSQISQAINLNNYSCPFLLCCSLPCAWTSFARVVSVHSLRGSQCRFTLPLTAQPQCFLVSRISFWSISFWILVIWNLFSVLKQSVLYLFIFLLFHFIFCPVSFFSLSLLKEQNVFISLGRECLYSSSDLSSRLSNLAIFRIFLLMLCTGWFALSHVILKNTFCSYPPQHHQACLIYSLSVQFLNSYVTTFCPLTIVSAGVLLSRVKVNHFSHNTR